MKNISLIILGACIALSFSFKKKVKGFFVSNEKPKTYMDSVSYAIGVYSQKNLESFQDSLNTTQFHLGFQDKVEGKSAFTQEQLSEIIQGFGQKLQREEEKKNELANVALIAEHDRFMKEAEGYAGVQKTASGLLYKVIEGGMGAAPKSTDKVRVDYKGTLPNGTVFDQNKGIEFPLNGVIKGWTEGLQLMSEGAVYEFYIPYQLAYGERGAGSSIGPYQALKFEVKLIKVK